MRGPIAWVRRHLNGWDEICVDENARLRNNNIFCTLLVSCISLFMLVFNLLQGNVVVGLFLVVAAALYTIMFLIQLFNTRYQRWATWVFGMMALAMSAFLLYWGGTGGLSYLWVFIVPHVAVMVAPLKDGIVYNILLLGVIVAALHSPLRQHLQYEYSGYFVILFPIAMFFVICCIYLAEMVRYRTQARLQATAQQLSSFAFTDPLTGVYNRHALTSHFGDVRSSDSEGLALAILDLDHFKNVNDNHGHFVGDKMLVHIVGLAQAAVPANAHLYRWGGEEFLLVLKTKDTGEAQEIWDAIRRAVEATPLSAAGEEISITVSIGGVCGVAGKTIHSCIQEADQYLYQAKAAGRNCCVVAPVLPA